MAGRGSQFLEYQRRHLDPEMFRDWLAMNPNLAKLNERQMGIPKAVKELDDFQKLMLTEVMKPALKRAGTFLAKAEKALAGRNVRSGTLLQSIGTLDPKVYWQHLTVWNAAGPKRGYARVVHAAVDPKAKHGFKYLRRSKAFTVANPTMQKVDPVKYAHFLITGRQASKAKPGNHSLMDSFTGTFFGHSVREETPKNFMPQSSADSAANIATEEMTLRLQNMHSTGG